MLVHEGDSRTSKIDLLLAAVLAFVAGGVNSAGFLAFGYFSANMTGNVSMISDHMSVREFSAALAFLMIVVMFVLGAFSASLFIEIGKQRRLANIYALTLLSEAALDDEIYEDQCSEALDYDDDRLAMEWLEQWPWRRG